MKLFVLFIMIGVLMILPPFASAQEDMYVTMYYPSPYGIYEQVRSNTVIVGWDSPNPTNNGELTWGANGNSRGRLVASTTVGSSIELGNSAGGSTPYIDFSNSTANYNARIQLTDANHLTIYVGTSLWIKNSPAANDWGDVQVGQLYICD